MPGKLPRLLYLALVICNGYSQQSAITFYNKQHEPFSKLSLRKQKISKQRRTQECKTTTCPENLSISIRLTPIPSKINEAEELLTSCAVPNTIKKFKQFKKEMFTAKVCFDNTAVLMAVKKQNTTIEDLEGGTKTSRSKFVRKKAKEVKKHVDCNGGCCKDCPSHRVKTVVLTTNNYEAVSSLVESCLANDRPVETITIKSTTKYLFDMCRDDKHILRSNKNVILLKTYHDKSFYKCKGKCDDNDVLDVTVVSSTRRSMNFAKNCAFGDSFKEDGLVEKGTSFSTEMKICMNDRLNLYRMKGIESVLPVCGIHNSFALSCGAKWDKAAPVCCDGLECNGVRCMDKSKTDGGTDGTCKKACSAEEAINVNVVVKAEENNSLGSTIGGILGSIGNALGIGSVSQDASQLIEACTVSKTGEPVPNEEAKTMTYPISICSEDKPALQANPNILSVDEGTVDKGKTEAPTEACEEGKCCKRCVVDDNVDEAETMKILVEVKSGGDGSTFVRTCITSELVRVAVEGENGVTFSSSICKGDLETMKKNPNLGYVKEDNGEQDNNIQEDGGDIIPDDGGDIIPDDGENNSPVNITLVPTNLTLAPSKNSGDSEVAPSTVSASPTSVLTYPTGSPFAQESPTSSVSSSWSGSASASGSSPPTTINDQGNNQDPNSAPDECKEGECCKSCTTSDIISQPGEDQQPETDISQILPVVVTANSQGITFLKSCATALTGTIQSDDNGNQILSITICKDDFNVIQDNADVISIVADTS